VNDLTKTVDTYLAMWNETDPARRARHIEQAWSAGARYVDPQADVEGYAGLSELVAAVQTRFPQHRFRRSSGIDAHHDRVRFAWELVGPNDSIVVAGIDVGVLAPDGRLEQITGFFGDLARTAEA
jgi:hypothetical protein